MKNIKSYLLIVFLFSLYTCDIVEEPYKKEASKPDVGDTIKKVLLEDFTGHKCQNCPNGHQTAAQLIENATDSLGNEHLIVIAIHAGYLAEPDPSGPFTYDFTSETGDNLFEDFQVVGIPVGMVNRKTFEGLNNKLLEVLSWESYVNAELNLPPTAYFEIENTYNETLNTLNVSVNGSFLEDMEGSYNLAIVLTEDSIIRPQLVLEGSPPAEVVDNYKHDHVFRIAINGSYGEFVAENPGKNTVFSADADITMQTDWNPDHCDVVAFLFENSSKEVIQVEKQSLIQHNQKK